MELKKKWMVSLYPVYSNLKSLSTLYTHINTNTHILSMFISRLCGNYWDTATGTDTLERPRHARSFIVFICAVAIVSTLLSTPNISSTPSSSHNF